MTNATLSTSWVVEKDKSNLYDKILHYMENHSMDVVEKNQMTISAKQGSPLITRLFGTFLTPAIYLPKKIIIELEELEMGTKINVNMREDIGLSVNTNLEYKYKNFFSVWLDDLKNHVFEL